MTPERAEAIYEEISKCQVELDSDPASRGPRYLQELIAKTRAYLNNVGRFVQEIHREQHSLQARISALQTDFDIQSDELLADGERVSGPSIDDRKAQVNVILAEQKSDLDGVRRELHDLDQVMKAVKFVHKELQDTMSAIRLQRSLIESEIRTGSMYGSEEGEGQPHNRVTMGDDFDDLDEILSEAHKQKEAEAALEDDLEEFLSDDPEPEPEPAPKPKPKTSKKAAKAEKKSKPKPEPKPAPVEEDDDDWSIYLEDAPSVGGSGEADPKGSEDGPEDADETMIDKFLATDDFFAD